MKERYVYEVRVMTEYSSSFIDYLNDDYVKWFKTQKEAISYARSIKKEVKEICKKKARDYDVFCLDVIQYWQTEDDEAYLYEDMIGVIYSINLVGKY